jgi:hypothetical protein
MMLLKYVCLASTITLFASGCVASISPIADPKAADANPSLYGAWECINKRGKDLCILPPDTKSVIVEPAGFAHAPGVMKLTFYPHRSWFNDQQLFCFLANVDGTTYLIATDKDLDKWSFTLKAEVTADTVTVWDSTPDIAKQAVTDFGLKTLNDNAVIWDSAENLRNFLQSDNGKSIFVVKYVFQRRGTLEQFAEQRNIEIEEAKRAVERQQKEYAGMQIERRKQHAAWLAAQQTAEAAKFRDWTTADGKSRVNAKFAGISRNGQCVLQFRDNKTIAIDIGRLSKDDQEFIRQSKWTDAK